MFSRRGYRPPAPKQRMGYCKGRYLPKGGMWELPGKVDKIHQDSRRSGHDASRQRAVPGIFSSHVVTYAVEHGLHCHIGLLMDRYAHDDDAAGLQCSR